VPPARTVSVPPLKMVVESDKPPEETKSTPPLDTTASLPVPAAEMISVPPLLIVVPAATPPDETLATPPLPIAVSDEEGIAALPAILCYDRRVVRGRFEERFTDARMAKECISVYRRLLKTRTSAARLRQVDHNGGIGLTPVLIEKPLRELVRCSSADVAGLVPLGMGTKPDGAN
jgi:hypothetical protein